MTFFQPTKMPSWLKVTLAYLIALVVLTLVSVLTRKYWVPPAINLLAKLEQNSPPIAAAPVVVEWEVDKEYGDKRTTLPNGRKLTVYHDYESTSTEWHWNVGGVTSSEREAMDAALHMGGLK